jgi:hypothetical protein
MKINALKDEKIGGKNGKIYSTPLNAEKRATPAPYEWGLLGILFKISY